MEISPIAGIRAMPVMKSPPAGTELTAVFDIASTSRTGDETWSPSDKKSARGSEDDGSEDELDEFEDESEPEAQTELRIPFAERNGGRQISYFA